jgi:Peptidase inhibitor family I36
MSRKTRVAMLIAVVPLTLLAIAPGQEASAAPTDGVCEDGELCMYSDDAYQGHMIDFPGNTCSSRGSHSSIKFPGTNTRIRNEVKSVWNRSGYVYEIYERNHFTGDSKTIFQFQRVDDLDLVERHNRSHQCVGS